MAVIPEGLLHKQCWLIFSQFFLLPGCFPPFFNLPCSFFSCKLLMLPTLCSGRMLSPSTTTMVSHAFCHMSMQLALGRKRSPTPPRCCQLFQVWEKSPGSRGVYNIIIIFFSFFFWKKKKLKTRSVSQWHLCFNKSWVHFLLWAKNIITFWSLF